MDISLSEFLDKIKSADASVRYAAWRAAGPMGAPAVEPLAELFAGTEKGVAKAAKGALEAIVHHAARPGAATEARAVAQALLQIAQSTKPLSVRSEAIHLTGYVADSKAIADLTKLLADAEVREEARMALERIPGSAATSALRNALRTVPADFQANIQQSLFHRSLTSKTVGITKMNPGN